MYKLILDTCPNPDFNETKKPAPKQTLEVKNLDEARAAFVKYRDGNHVGGGNMKTADLLDATGTKIGHFSYNARLWDMKDKELTVLPIPTTGGKVFVTTVLNSPGHYTSANRKFNVVLVPKGAKYGLNDGLTNESEMMVEFYDATHAGEEGFGPLGQFVSRYALSTLTEDGARLVRDGLDLDGGIAEWKLDSYAIAQALFEVYKICRF